ncbi:Flp pilus assembly protein CpaB [Fretibacter rubidus]|uniref:Flp pilus assembly protein CpaB n=1 Tax=Fretibacter rubidus TaxID=570162 RepID=UPI00352B664C
MMIGKGWDDWVMRTNTIITLGASAAFGIMAVFLARGFINDAVEDEFRQVKPASTNEAAVPMDTVAVLVANRDMAFGEALSRTSVRFVDYPSDAVPAGAFTDLSDIFESGSERFTLSNLSYNEPILARKITGEDGKASLSARIKPGYRAVSIRVDDVTGVSGFIMPGDIVDVIYTREPATSASSRSRNTSAAVSYISDIILQNVSVLAVDQNQSDRSASPDVANTVTLEVSDADSQKLALAMNYGTLSLSLRGVGETAPSPTQQVSLNELGAKQSRSVARRPSAKKSKSPTSDITVFRNGPDNTESVERLSVKRQNDVNIVVYGAPAKSATLNVRDDVQGGWPQNVPQKPQPRRME